MTNKSHWPFGGDPWGKGGRSAGHDEDATMRASGQASAKQRIRNDRLIVGGRAHVKKSGLS